MKENIKEIRYLEYDAGEDLHGQDKVLLDNAEQAVSNAYAPYSGYRVGAAVLLEDDIIIKANNQENAAFPSGLCAERVALFYAHANYPDKKIKAIAVTVKTDKFEIKNPVSPCGACRQVIAEYETKQDLPIRMILSAENNKKLIIEGIEKLLPFLFKAEELKRH